MGFNNGNGNGHYDSGIIGHVAYQLGCISPTHCSLQAMLYAGSAPHSLVSFPLCSGLVSPFHSQIKGKYCSIDVKNIFLKNKKIYCFNVFFNKKKYFKPPLLHSSPPYKEIKKKKREFKEFQMK